MKRTTSQLAVKGFATGIDTVQVVLRPTSSLRKVTVVAKGKVIFRIYTYL